MAMRFFFCIFFSFLIIESSLSAEGSISVLVGRNSGEYVFETGSKYPNLSGILGGSRISFDRNYNLGGFGGNYNWKRWEFRGQFLTTGWYVPTGRARDEDFFTGTTTRERTTNIATREFAYYDSVNVFSGTRNYADGVGKSSMSEYRLGGSVRFFLGDSSSDGWNRGSGSFVSFGSSYSYFKFIFYDVNQWVASSPPIYLPIGLGMTFSNAMLEVMYGGGYRWKFDDFYIESSLQFLTAGIKTRDFHVQRNINFISQTYGNGLLFGLSFGYSFDSDLIIYAKIDQHRVFTRGEFIARGGLTQSDILSNFVGKFRANINIKESLIEIGATKRVGKLE